MVVFRRLRLYYPSAYLTQGRNAMRQSVCSEEPYIQLHQMPAKVMTNLDA